MQIPKGLFKTCQLWGKIYQISALYRNQLDILKNQNLKD